MSTTYGDFAWLQQLARFSPVGIFRTDLQGRNIYSNARWCEMTGRTAASALGFGWEAAIHPEDLSRVREVWQRTIEQTEPHRTEVRYVRPDGTVVWTFSEVVEERDGSGEVCGFIGIITDVTELHDVREELQHTQEELEQRVAERTRQWRDMVLIVEQMDDAVIWSDVAGRIIGWNQGAEKLFGYTRAEVLGGSTLAIIPAEEQGMAIDIERRARLGESIHHREVMRIAKGGKAVPALLSVFPLRNEAGSIMGSASILRDLTARKKNEGRLRQLSQRLLGAQDEERRRIARELHDSTAQLLVALAINLNRVCMNDATLSVEARAQMLAESALLAERATVEVRTQSYLLHPPLLEERGLVAALRFFIDGFTERSGITVNFHAPKQLVRLEPLVELTLFRIVQEALANVHRHSQSVEAEIILTVQKERIELVVRDFGSGLPADPGELRGVGVAGMRERVAQLGGSFELESAEPGVKVRVGLPMGSTSL